MFTIAPLKWVNHDAWVAKTPAGHNGYITICFEEDLFWACWKDAQIDGFVKLEEAQAAGQKFHEDFLKQYLTQEN